MTRISIWTANFVIHALRMQHVMARISHVTQVGFPTAQSVRNAALRIRPVQAPTITVVCRVFMTAMVNATRVLIMRLVPADMNIFIANRGITSRRIKTLHNNVYRVQIMCVMAKNLSVVVLDIIYIIRNVVLPVPHLNIVRLERQLLCAKKAIIKQPLDLAPIVQLDIIARIIPWRQMCINIVQPAITAQVAVAANAPMTLCALAEKWMK